MTTSVWVFIPSTVSAAAEVYNPWVKLWDTIINCQKIDLTLCHSCARSNQKSERAQHWYHCLLSSAINRRKQTTGNGRIVQMQNAAPVFLHRRRLAGRFQANHTISAGG